ncbi:hypothetical protein BC827DRAFT_1151787 [Russula dissimulans]|nr:hypothetical protein BC827DRAFT_1151787 [Russula dissimulans]
MPYELAFHACLCWRFSLVLFPKMHVQTWAVVELSFPRGCHGPDTGFLRLKRVDFLDISKSTIYLNQFTMHSACLWYPCQAMGHSLKKAIQYDQNPGAGTLDKVITLTSMPIVIHPLCLEFQGDSTKGVLIWAGPHVPPAYRSAPNGLDIEMKWPGQDMRTLDMASIPGTRSSAPTSSSSHVVRLCAVSQAGTAHFVPYEEEGTGKWLNRGGS